MTKKKESNTKEIYIKPIIVKHEVLETRTGTSICSP